MSCAGGVVGSVGGETMMERKMRFEDDAPGTESELYLVVKVPNGYGWMTQSQYDEIPKAERAAVDVIAGCRTEEWAKWLFHCLPQEWIESAAVARPMGAERARQRWGVRELLVTWGVRDETQEGEGSD